MKFKVKDINKHIVASDTDSIFIGLKPLLVHRYPDLDLSDKDKVIPLVKEIQKEVEKRMEFTQKKLAKNILNSNNHFFDLKSESIIQRAYWSGKRRYAQLIVDKEGISVEELDIKGLDLMKSNFPPLFRKFSEDLIKSIMNGESKDSIDIKVLDFKQSLKEITWRDFLKPTGVKNIQKYISKSPEKGEMFSKLEKRCPVNSKAAIIFNDFICYHNLDKKFPTFQVGDKMFIANLKNNPYNIKVIGFNGYNDPPEVTDMIDNYINKDQLFDSLLKNKIENMYSDLGWGGVIFNTNVSKFFKW